jgi:hypothetical protein
MPTISEWQQALEFPRRILVDSTQALADEINSLPGSERFTNAGGIAKHAVGLPEFDPPRNIYIAPIEILAAIGRITTPKTDNLADLSSTWAIIRYIWAIQPSPAGTKMCLSQIAKEIDFHQKALLSDEMGVGFAYYIISNYFDGTNPVDVDVVLNYGGIPNLRQVYNTKPDYIFEHQADGYLLVECKGSQGNDYDSKKQIRRGLEQVPSLEINGIGLRSYVVGSRLSTDGVKTLIIDPPNDDKSSSNKDSRKKYRIDKEKFEHVIQVAQTASLYQFVGRFEKANLLLFRNKDYPQREDMKLTNQRIDFLEEDYIGQVQELRYSGETGNVRVFQGVPTHTYELMERENYNSIAKEGRYFFAKAKAASALYKERNDFAYKAPEGAYIVDRTDHTLRASVVDRDGAITRIDIS